MNDPADANDARDDERESEAFEFQLDAVTHYEPIDEMPEIEFDDAPPRREMNDKYKKTYSAGFAMLLIGLGLVAVVPVVFFWSNVLTDRTLEQLPRWAYLMMLVGGLFGVYAVFVAQIRDWCALRAVSIILLIAASLFAIVAAGISLDRGTGLIVSFLQLPDELRGQAAIWSLLMLSLVGLVSYLCGRESAFWQQATRNYAD